MSAKISKHHLFAAMSRTLIEDSNSIREKDFKEIADRTPIINLVYKFHTAIRPNWLSALMVAAYGYKSYLALSVKKKNNQKILFTYAFPNEKGVGQYISNCCKQDLVTEVSHSNSLLFSFQSFILLLQTILNFNSVIKYLRIAYRINKRNTFMPTCRALGAICFYLRLKKELVENDFSAVLVSKTYSPDCLALVWAAKSLNISTIFCSHSFIPPVKMRKPSQLYSLLILQGEKMKEILESRAKLEGKIIYKGIDGLSKPLNIDALKSDSLSVGVFLSGSLDIEGICFEIERIQKEIKPKQVLIRLHPVALASANINSLKDKYDNVVLTFGTKIASDLEKCDLVFVGNSGVMLEVLKAGCPCVYLSKLELIDFDYNGFVEGEIVPYWEKDRPFNLSKIVEFYSESWLVRFRKYDPYYLQEAEVDSLIKQEINRLI